MYYNFLLNPECITKGRIQNRSYFKNIAQKKIICAKNNLQDQSRSFLYIWPLLKKFFLRIFCNLLDANNSKTRNRLVHQNDPARLHIQQIPMIVVCGKFIPTPTDSLQKNQLEQKNLARQWMRRNSLCYPKLTHKHLF